MLTKMNENYMYRVYEMLPKRKNSDAKINKFGEEIIRLYVSAMNYQFKMAEKLATVQGIIYGIVSEEI